MTVTPEQVEAIVGSMKVLLLLLVPLAAAVERALELLKPFIDPKRVPEKYLPVVKTAIAVCFGLIAAFATGLNAFAVLGFPDIAPWFVGCIVSGLMVSTGSTTLHLLLTLLSTLRDGRKQPIVE